MKDEQIRRVGLHFTQNDIPLCSFTDDRDFLNNRFSVKWMGVDCMAPKSPDSDHAHTL